MNGELQAEYIALLFRTFYKDWISDYPLKGKSPSLEDAERFLNRFTERGMDIKAFKNVFGREPTPQERQKIREKFFEFVSSMLKNQSRI